SGYECPPGHVCSLDLMADHLAQSHPNLLVVVLSPDAERALNALEELRLLTQVPVLVVGPATDSRLVLRALRKGASDYIDEAELAADLPAALARLKDELPTRTEPGRTKIGRASC